MKRLRLASPATPYATVMFCPVCGDEIHREQQDDLRPTLLRAIEAEATADRHLRARHPIRYWLWRRLRWATILAA